MTTSAQAILRTVEHIYDAAIEPDAWSHCLDSVRDLVGGSHAVFTITTARGADLATCRQMHAPHDAHCDRILNSDFWARQMGRFPTAVALPQSAMVPVPEYARTDFYQQLIRPVGGGLAAVAVPWRNPSSWAAIRVCRPLDDRDFDGEELRTLQALVPHLANAGRMRCRLMATDPRTTGALAAIDALGIGLMLVDRRGSITYRNLRAEEVMAARDGLYTDGPGLTATLPAENRALQQAIATALLLQQGGETADAALRRAGRIPLRLAVSRRPPQGPLILTIVPAPAIGHQVGLESSGVAVLISDPGRRLQIDTSGLAAAYGLTRREADLAALIADGIGPAEAAATLGIATSTARQYLKTIFEKTETHRQADLVRLLLHGFATAGAAARPE